MKKLFYSIGFVIALGCILWVAYKFYPKETVTIIKRDTILVSKIDTVLKDKIVYVTKQITKYDTVVQKENVFIVQKFDSLVYSWTMFDTKFEAIKVGAYAESPVDSFTFENFPKPVILVDTLYFKPKRKIHWKWALGGVLGGILTWELVR